MKYTKDRIGLLVADTLHAINYEIRNKISYEKSYKKSLQKGTKFIEILKELIEELPEKEQKRIDIIRWDDIKKEKLYRELFPIAKKEFREDNTFKEAILDIIREQVKQEDRIFSKKDIERFGEYIIEELPELANGFIFKNTYYNCYLYPYYSKLAQFVEDLQQGKIFTQISEKLVKRYNVFVELR